MSKSERRRRNIFTINKVEEKCFEMDCDCIDSNWQGLYCQCLRQCNKKAIYEYQKQKNLMKSLENQIDLKT